MIKACEYENIYNEKKSCYFDVFTGPNIMFKSDMVLVLAMLISKI